MRKTLLAALFLALCLTGCKSSDYKDACLLQDAQAYQAAAENFENLGSYRDSAERAQLCRNILTYQEAVALQQDGAYDAAAEMFGQIPGYEDADARRALCQSWAEALD